MADALTIIVVIAVVYILWSTSNKYTKNMSLPAAHKNTEIVEGEHVFHQPGGLKPTFARDPVINTQHEDSIKTIEGATKTYTTDRHYGDAPIPSNEWF